jgi:putative membrane protein
MIRVAQVAAFLAGTLHVLFFVMESVLFTRPAVHRRFRVAAAEVGAVRPWAFNQGFYNLFLAVGLFAGLLLGVDTDAGRALLVLTCGSMVGAALVLVASNRRMARAAAVQGILPLVALVAVLL